VFERHVVDRPRAHARSRDGATGGRHLPAHLRGGLFAQSGQVLARGDGVPGAVLHANVTRRWSGSRAMSQSSGRMTTPWVSTQHLGQDDGERPSAGPSPRWRNSRTVAAACSGAGTSNRRVVFGSVRMSAVTNSSRNPGTCQSNPSAATRLRISVPTWTVTPSAAAPGSNW
jgi:hypothetical protein